MNAPGPVFDAAPVARESTASPKCGPKGETMNATQTATAWTVDTSVIKYGWTGFPVMDGDTEVCRVPARFITTELDAQGNAAHPENAPSRKYAQQIVRAVNAHDALMAACEGVCESYRTYDMAGAVKKCRAALALARGEPVAR